LSVKEKKQNWGAGLLEHTSRGGTSESTRIRKGIRRIPSKKKKQAINSSKDQMVIGRGYSSKVKRKGDFNSE